MDTFIIKKNYKSDFILREVFRNSDGDRIDIPQCDFRFVYSTVNSNKQYIASRKGDVYNNCRKYDDNTIEVIFNNHGLKPGMLKKELQLDFPNDTFPDGIQNIFIPSCASVELWEGPSYGSKVIQEYVVVDYIATIIKDYNLLENKPIINLIGTEEMPVVISSLEPFIYNVSGFIKIDDEKVIEISSTSCNIIQRTDEKIAIFSGFVLIYNSVDDEWALRSKEKIVTFPTDEDSISDYDPLINSYVYSVNGWARLNDFLYALKAASVLKESEETQVINSDLALDHDKKLLGVDDNEAFHNIASMKTYNSIINLEDVQVGINLRDKVVNFDRTSNPKFSGVAGELTTSGGFGIIYSSNIGIARKQGASLFYIYANGGWLNGSITFPDDQDYIVQSNNLPDAIAADSAWTFKDTTIETGTLYTNTELGNLPHQTVIKSLSRPKIQVPEKEEDVAFLTDLNNFVKHQSDETQIIDSNIAVGNEKKILSVDKNGEQHELIGLGEYDVLEQIEVGNTHKHLNLNTIDNITCDTPNGKKQLLFPFPISQADFDKLTELDDYTEYLIYQGE